MTCPPCTHDCEQGKTCPAKNNNEIIEMAGKAKFFVTNYEVYSPSVQEDHELTPYLKAFAALVAAKEREACAKVCEQEAMNWPPSRDFKLCAAAIRARGQA